MALEESPFYGWGTELQGNYMTAKVTQWVSGEVGIWMCVATSKPFFFSSTDKIKRSLRFGDPRVFCRVRNTESPHVQEKRAKEKELLLHEGRKVIGYNFWLVELFLFPGLYFSHNFRFLKTLLLLRQFLYCPRLFFRAQVSVSGNRAVSPGPITSQCFVLGHPS